MNEFEQASLPTTGFRSKDWIEFAQPGAPELHFVFTVCDSAAQEICPVWPDQPMTAHWRVRDPAAVNGALQDFERAFHDASITFDRRISLFLSLPLLSLDQLALKKKVDEIGKS